MLVQGGAKCSLQFGNGDFQVPAFRAGANVRTTSRLFPSKVQFHPSLRGPDNTDEFPLWVRFPANYTGPHGDVFFRHTPLHPRHHFLSDALFLLICSHNLLHSQLVQIVGIHIFFLLNTGFQPLGGCFLFRRRVFLAFFARGGFFLLLCALP